MSQTIAITQPNWLENFHQMWVGRLFPRLEERMQLVIGCQRNNVEHRTGGPFAAAVFEKDSGKLVSIGVNCVEASHCCYAHAEIIALASAEQQLGTYNLADPRFPQHQLVSSGQMCIMCYGAVIWSGIHEIVYGVSAKDIEAINGFDEGPMPEHWVQQLQERKMNVIAEFQCEQAKIAHYRYRELGGNVYSPSKV